MIITVILFSLLLNSCYFSSFSSKSSFILENKLEKKDSQTHILKSDNYLFNYDYNSKYYLNNYNHKYKEFIIDIEILNSKKERLNSFL